MPIRLSYINARNEEIVLDDDEHSFAGELAGRTGFEMPEIETKTVTYGDGSQDVVVSRMKSREVTCYFWVDLDKKIEFERQLNQVKSRILQTGSRMGNWGKLKIRQRDGEYRYLNCIYKSGFNAIVRDNNVRMKFSLTFEATDPLFYNTFESKYVIKTPKTANFQLMKPLVFDGEDNEYNFSKDNITENPNGLFMRQLSYDTRHKEKRHYYENDERIVYDYIYYDFSKDTVEHNPDCLYMQTPSMNTNNDLELECNKVYPTIMIEGTAKNIRIYNKLTDKSIVLSGFIEVNHSNYVLIETKPLKRKIVSVDVETGKETNLIASLQAGSTLDFPLERGENTIIFRNTYASPESKCTFIYTEGWLSCN